jgi:hypothetical protein
MAATAVVRSWAATPTGRQRFHGFLKDRRGFRRIDSPGAPGTWASRIDERGRIVGSYSERRATPAGQFEHGFLLTGSRFTRLDVPGASHTRPSGINKVKQVVGEYVDRAGTLHGFLRERDGSVATIDAPGASATAAYDIDDHGRIVGRGALRCPRARRGSRSLLRRPMRGEARPR